MISKYKILRVCASDLFAKTALLPEIDFLINKGCTIHISFPGGDITSELTGKGYLIKLVNSARRISPISNILTIIQLYKLIKKEKYDIVHTHNHLIGILARIAAKVAGAPTIIHSPHGFYFHDDMPRYKYWVFYYIEKFMGYFTDLLFIENIENYEMCIKTNLISKKKLYYMGGGINLTRFDGKKLSTKNKTALMNKLNIPQDSFPIIGITSRITYEKGYRELIQSVNQLRDTYPKIFLLIVGAYLKNERDSFLRELNKSISNYSLGRHVKITLEPNVEDFLRIMDIWTLPSYREGLPRSIQEAMAMGLPVVATNIRGCRNLVVQNNTGLLVSPKNVDELTTALNKLIKDDNLRSKFGFAGSKYAQKNFSNDIVMSRMFDGYMSVIK
jgi:glycosyltransferase involved in cell wall biosynthesis